LLGIVVPALVDEDEQRLHVEETSEQAKPNENGDQ